MTYHTPHSWKAQPQCSLELIDFLMHGSNLDAGIHAAVEVDDLASLGFAYAHIMDLTDEPNTGCNLLERVGDSASASRPSA